MYGLRVYPGIHLFIGRCCDFFFPPVMNRISLEAYPLLPFISPSLLPSLHLPPSLSSPSQKAKLKYCIFKALVLLSCCCSLSVSMMWKRLKVIPFLANPSTLYNFDSVLHLALSEQQGVYLWQSLCALWTFLLQNGISFFNFLSWNNSC